MSLRVKQTQRHGYSKSTRPKGVANGAGRGDGDVSLEI